MSLARRLPLLAAALAALATAAPAGATTTGDGVQHLSYRFGPLAVTPGQNTIDVAPTSLRPDVPGYITKFTPNLEYADGSIPGVDVIHLHHGVWLVDGEARFAVGEEKTIADLPSGYGWRYAPRQKWLVNSMVHNLTPKPATVYITYKIDFVPDTVPEAAGMKTVRTQWMDVAGPSAYPVFDALRKDGRNGRLTVPDDVPTLKGLGPEGTWTITQPTTLVQTAVHLHPGGLNGYLTVTRGDRTVRIFTSRTRYWEPAGPVSWDVAMTSTPADWRVALLPGDVVRLHVVYDVSKASWYESMGIMPIATEDAADPTALDPFTQPIPQKGRLTHGHLAENDNHGGGAPVLPDPLKKLDGPMSGAQVVIDNFVYRQGDMTLSGMPGRPPVVRAGRSLTFYNKDATLPGGGIFHTITACRAPCNRSTGIAYPRADGPVDFDSGELGFGPAGLTAAANVATWKTPTNLKPGTYTYFCRIHPFMRGSFRVVPAKQKRKQRA